MRRPIAALLAGLACLTVAGCEEPTEIVVAMDTDLFIPEELRTVGLEVAFTDTAVRPLPTVASKTWEVDRNIVGAIELPATIGLMPGKDPDRPIEIAVSGYGDPKNTGKVELVVVRQARLTFVKERVLLLSMNLLRSCMYIFCPDGQTCINGECLSSKVDSSKLVEYDPSFDLE